MFKQIMGLAGFVLVSLSLMPVALANFTCDSETFTPKYDLQTAELSDRWYVQATSHAILDSLNCDTVDFSEGDGGKLNLAYTSYKKSDKTPFVIIGSISPTTDPERRDVIFYTNPPLTADYIVLGVKYDEFLIDYLCGEDEESRSFTIKTRNPVMDQELKNVLITMLKVQNFNADLLIWAEPDCWSAL